LPAVGTVHFRGIIKIARYPLQRRKIKDHVVAADPLPNAHDDKRRFGPGFVRKPIGT